MLKYKLRKGAINPLSSDPVKEYLVSLGVEEPDHFLRTPPSEDRLSHWLLEDIHKCIQFLHEAFVNNASIFLIVDSDTDGYTSSSIFYNYFIRRYPEAKIEWMLHDGKEHGIIMNRIPHGCDYVVVPDAGSMNLQQQEELVNMGKKVIIIDHHHVDGRFYHENVVLVNNQTSPHFSNKALSGAGMVLKVIEAYDEVYPDLFVRASDFYDLAALGILSDCMDMRTLDNNYIVYKGLHNIKNAMLAALLKKQAFSIKDVNLPTKTEIVFYVSPIVNGVIREGTQEEKSLLFRGFLEGSKTTMLDRDEIARLSYNTKTRQDRKKNKYFLALKSKIEKEGADKNKIIIAIVTDAESVGCPSTLNGLIAMELQKEYKKPALVLRARKEKVTQIIDGVEVTTEIHAYSGSARAAKAEGFNSFLQFMKKDPAVIYAEGHDFAFGTSIKASELKAFIARSNEALASIDFGTDFIEVEQIFKESVNQSLLLNFANQRYLYTTGIPEPRFAIEAYVPAQNIFIMGQDRSSVRIKVGQLSCVALKKAQLAEQLDGVGNIKCKIVGKVELNTWNGRTDPQIKIEGFEFEEVAARSLF